MKGNANWCVRLWTAVLVLTISVAAFSCGGGGTTGIENAGGSNVTGDNSVSGNRTVGLQTIREDEVASLPGWMQDLLSDPGWNQPYIEPRAKTPMPAPSYEQLMELTRERLANPPAFSPRPVGESAGKGVSWNANGGFDGETLVYEGEYATAGAQPFGCVNGTVNGHAKEDNLSTVGDFPNGAPQRISYVRNGLSGVNHFNSTGGSGTDAFSAIYQLYSSDRSANPTRAYDDYDPETETIPNFGEISYRADGGAGAGGACNGTAYIVEDFFWWEFNSELTALPGSPTSLFNVLIAPSGERTTESESAMGTSGRYQPFYLGNVSNCYGGGGIVGLMSSSETCDTEFGMSFADLVASDGLFFTNPVYGVLLSRWLDAVPGGADLNDPTDGNNLGWPVFGPIAYNNGVATLTGFGAYYAWGMYYEKGFVWWLDYVNNGVVPDEAQTFEYTGDNVYCADDETYVELPTVFYGGQGGALGVSVVVDASLNPDYTATGGAPAGSYYEVALPAAAPQVTLNMFANGYGGVANAACAYKHYTWAFRDGSIGLTNATAFDNSTKYVSHTYGYPLGGQNTESVYIVRVQVVDASNAIAYGDSLPIHLGHAGAGGGDGEIWVVRNDDSDGDETYGDYPANYDALIADLDALGCDYTELDYSSTLPDDFDASADGKVVIWYRGGPGAAGEPLLTTAWTDEEIDNYIQLQKNGAKVLLVSQNHGLRETTFIPVIGWSGIYGYTVQPPATGTVPPFGTPDKRRHAWAAGLGTDDGIGFGGSFGFIPCAPTSAVGNAGGPDGRFGSDSSNAAERYTGGGSSGQVPVTVPMGKPRQFCGIGWYSPIFNFTGIANSNFRAGITCNPTALGFDLGYLSWGNQASPDENIGGFPSYQHTNGTGKVWIIGYGWAETSVTAPAGMTRADMLRNMLAWLDGSLTFAAVTNKGFSEYEGIPEIVSVTPAYWDETNFQYRNGTPQLSYTGDAGSGFYPDQTGLDVYRSTDNPLLDNEVVTVDPNNDWVNGNDVDFQFPGNYAYIKTGGNGVVEEWNEIGVPPATDDTILFLRGYLADDAGDGSPNQSWARFTPGAGNVPVALSNMAIPRPTVAGYYTQPQAGDSGAGDTFSNYGTELAATNGGGMAVAGKEWKNSRPLTCESIAHWSQSLKYFDFAPFNDPQDPVLNWSMYPGQFMTIPGGGGIVGVTATWDDWRNTFNVDPTTTVTGRSGTAWNRPVFSYNSPLLDSTGRVVEFNYRKVKSWNPDLNRDGTVNNSDKFPVRVRLFSNHQAYYNKTTSPASVWPDHLQDPGLAPPGWELLTPADPGYPSFIEGGCYVVDRGEAVYNMQALDNPAQPDPGGTGTLSGNTGNYQLDFYYIIRFGTAPYTVDIDFDWGGAFNDGTAGRVTMAAEVEAANGANSAIDEQVPVAMPNGNYLMAIRVTDSTAVVDGGPQTATFVWPGQVTLAPQFSVVIINDLLDDSVAQGGNNSTLNMQTDLSFLYGAGAVTTIVAPAAGTAFNAGQLAALNGANAVFWCSDEPFAFADTGYSGPANGNFSLQAGDPKIATLSSLVSAGKTLFIAGGASFRLEQQAFWTSGTFLPFLNTSTWFFDGNNTGPNYFFGTAGTIPNNLSDGSTAPGVNTRGYNTARAGAVGVIGCEQNFSTASGTVACVRGFRPTTNSFPCCSYRVIGSGAVFQLALNYGDLAGTQFGLNRALYLENLLCRGSFASPFNSPST